MRSDLDTLLLPLLQMLYAADRRTPSQMYMLLIIVLLLSQDAAFAANVHRCAPGPVQHASVSGAGPLAPTCRCDRQLDQSHAKSHPLLCDSPRGGQGLPGMCAELCQPDICKQAVCALVSWRAIFPDTAHSPVPPDSIAVGSVPWYKERVVMKTTLGSLLTVVLLRTAHHNLAKLRVCAVGGGPPACLFASAQTLSPVTS